MGYDKTPLKLAQQITVNSSFSNGSIALHDSDSWFGDGSQSDGISDDDRFNSDYRRCWSEMEVRVSVSAITIEIAIMKKKTTTTISAN
jgi:hypothetical protein